MGRYAYGGDDWMGGSVVDNDRDEARSAAYAAERANEPHPDGCRCRPCLTDRSGILPGQKET